MTAVCNCPLDFSLFCYIIRKQIKIVRNCVRVAQQTLTLLVWVRILFPQPKNRLVKASRFFYPMGKHPYGNFYDKDW